MPEANDNGNVKISRTMLIYGMGLILSAFGFFLKIAFANIETTKTMAENTKTRVDYLETRFLRFEDKLDKIGDRLGVKQ